MLQLGTLSIWYVLFLREKAQVRYNDLADEASD